MVKNVERVCSWVTFAGLSGNRACDPLDSLCMSMETRSESGECLSEFVANALLRRDFRYVFCLLGEWNLHILMN